jgi:hypothetical protein
VRPAAILKCLLLLACCAGVLLAEDLPVGVLQTARAMNANRDLLKSLPLHTCLETISRSHSKSGRRKPKRADVVQVDVGVGPGQEMYSWPGQSTFSSQALPALVGHGLLSTGLFESFATNLFVLGHGYPRLIGEENIEGKRALHFAYTVPSLENRWTINWFGAQGTADEDGDFWVDTRNYTLLRLSVRAKTIPPNLALSALTASIDYQASTLNGRAVLLPKLARVIAIESNGAMLQDDAAFSHCHVFEAGSRLLGSSGNLSQALTQYESHRGMLPAGLTLRISLQTPVIASSAKAGDDIAARLDEPLKISAKITAPRGSILRGHVRQSEKLDDPPRTFVVGLAFDELEWPGHSYAFLAETTGTQPLVGLSNRIYRGSSRTASPFSGAPYFATTEAFSLTDIPGVATFFLQGALTLPAGFQMTWRTTKLTHPP